MEYVKCKCVSKNRDRKGNIVNYGIEDENGFVRLISGKQLKVEMNNGRIVMDNLQIDKAGRLVDKKVEIKKLGMEKSIDLLNFMELGLMKGKAVVIPKLETDKRFTPDELNTFIPKYLIKPMMVVMENSPTGTAIRNMCETLVPLAVKNVESKGYKVSRCTITYSGVDVEIFEVVEVSK